jgi:hypothetical protein
VGVELQAGSFQTVTLSLTSSSAPDATDISPALSLEQNRPNPFSPGTSFKFTLPERASIKLAIYDPAGREVRRLVSGPVPAGESACSWSGRDDRGRRVEPGIYFVRLVAGERALSRKILLMR